MKLEGRRTQGETGLDRRGFGASLQSGRSARLPRFAGYRLLGPGDLRRPPPRCPQPGGRARNHLRRQPDGPRWCIPGKCSSPPSSREPIRSYSRTITPPETRLPPRRISISPTVLSEAGGLMGIDVLDHVIVAPPGGKRVHERTRDPLIWLPPPVGPRREWFPIPAIAFSNTSAGIAGRSRHCNHLHDRPRVPPRRKKWA